MPIVNTSKSYYDITNISLSTNSYLRIFPILEDSKNNIKFLNIYRSYDILDEIKNNIIFYNYYNMDEYSIFDLISLKFYNSESLWWIIPLVNNMLNPFEDGEEGKNIKILKNDYVYCLLKNIDLIGNT